MVERLQSLGAGDGQREGFEVAEMTGEAIGDQVEHLARHRIGREARG